jgi:hypothetical protein
VRIVKGVGVVSTSSTSGGVSTSSTFGSSVMP